MDIHVDDADFSPFPSKIFALLFILLHALRPIVCYHSYSVEIFMYSTGLTSGLLVVDC